MSRTRNVLCVCIAALLLGACGVSVDLDQAGSSATPAASAAAQAEASTADAATAPSLPRREPVPTDAAPSRAGATSSAAAQSTTAPSPSQSASSPEATSSVAAEAAPSEAAAASGPADGEVVEGSAPAEGEATEVEATTAACPSPAPIVAGETQPVAAVDAPPALLLILDSSGSMQENDGSGRPKIDAAKEALNTLVDSLPDGAPVGLRVYGHRVPNTDKANGCNDTELIAPIAPLDKAVMKERIASFEATGFTPIATSLQEAAKDLPAEGERTVVLVSDGEETCDRDPCQVARDLEAQGIDLAVETVGFQVDETTRSQLECIAEATGGQYHDAADAAQLAATLQQISSRALRTYQPSGTAVQGGDSLDSATVLQPGQYTDTISTGRTLYYAVELQAGQRLDFTATVVGQTDVGITDDIGAQLDLSLLAPDGDQIESDLKLFGDDNTTVVVRSDAVPAAGTYVVVFAANQSSDGLQARLFESELLVRIDGQSCVPIAAAVPPGPVQGSGDFNNAPPLTSGAYQDTIQTNETLYYAVYLEQGQGLRGQVTLEGRPDVKNTDAIGSRMDVELFTPVRESIESEGVSGFGNETVELQIEFPSVSEAGLYYISIKPDQYTNLMDGIAFNLTLAVEIIE